MPGPPSQRLWDRTVDNTWHVGCFKICLSDPSDDSVTTHCHLEVVENAPTCFATYFKPNLAYEIVQACCVASIRW